MARNIYVVLSIICFGQWLFALEQLDTLFHLSTLYTVPLRWKFDWKMIVQICCCFSVLGRSITFHTEFRGAPRFACADIIPDSSAAVTRVEHSYPEAVPFDK